MKFAFISICLFCAANVMALKNDKREIEFGMEFTTELPFMRLANVSWGPLRIMLILRKEMNMRLS